MTLDGLELMRLARTRASVTGENVEQALSVLRGAGRTPAPEGSGQGITAARTEKLPRARARLFVVGDQ